MIEIIKNKKKAIVLFFSLFLIIAGIFAWNNRELKNVFAVGEGWLSGWNYRKQIEAASGKVGTMNGNVFLSDSAKFNKAASFDGNGDYISFTDSDDWDFGTENFTIDLWIKFNEIKRTEILSTGSTDNYLGSGQYGWDLTYNEISSNLQFELQSSNSWLIVMTRSFAPAIGNWYHVAVVGNNQNLYMFVNGTQLGAAYPYSASIISQRPIHIGASSYSTPNNFLNGYIDEVRISKGIARWTSNFTPSTSAYTSDQYDVLLLHMDEKDQNTIVSSNLVSGQTDYQFKVDVPYNEKMKTDFSDIRFTSSDGSTQLNYWMEEKNRKTGTVNGNPVFGSTGKFGTSLAFDGTGDYVSIPDSDDWDFGPSNFTIDAWVKRTTSGTYFPIAKQGSGPSNDDPQWSFFIGSENVLRFYHAAPGGFAISSTTTITDTDWHHVAVSRSGSNWYLFIDGQVVATSSSSGVCSNLPYSLIIGWGYYYSASGYANGSLDELRISKGIARWTSNFTPSTSAYTADQYDVLLLHLDEASGYKTATSSNSLVDVGYVNGNPVLGSTGKFGTAITMDGSGDFISIPDSDDWYFGTGDFTIDFWINPSDLTGVHDVFGQSGSDAAGYSPILIFTNGTTMTLYSSSSGSSWDVISGASIATSLQTGVWQHIAIVRSGSNFYSFQNGVLKYSATTSGSFWNSPNSLIFGSRKSVTPDYYWQGGMDEVRISKGIARWTSNFTPSTSAYTADQYTKLLLHMNDQVSSGVVISETIMPFWVKASSLSTSNINYLYYGKGDTSTTSNGDNTFVFFDDFNNGIVDSGKWTASGTWTENGGTIVSPSGGLNYLRSASEVLSGLSNFVVEGKTKALHSYGYGMRLGLKTGATPAANGTQYEPIVAYTFGAYSPLMVINGSNVGNGGKTASTNTWYRGKIMINPGASSIYQYDSSGSLFASCSTASTSAGSGNYMAIFNADGQTEQDWIFVRKYGISLASISGEESISGFLMKKDDGCSCTEAIECYYGTCNNGLCGLGSPTATNLYAPSEI